MFAQLSLDREFWRKTSALTTLAFAFAALDATPALEQTLRDQVQSGVSSSEATALAVVAPDRASLASTVGKARLDDPSVDESALRYYASTGQSERRDAELQRLRRLYPNWTPPGDIYEKTATAGVDEEELWDLFSADRLDQLRIAIEERRASEPGWEPSLDLRAKLRAKAFRNQVMSLAREERFAEVAQFIKTTGQSLDGVDIDVLWTVAEAYSKSHQNDEALAIYKTILTSNADAGQRLATIQKSMSVMRMDEVEQLLARARKDASGKSEFWSIRNDITRARISAFLHDERTDELSENDLGDFGGYARSAADPNQPALLAWYYFKLKRYQPALDWFKFAIEHGGDAMVAHGLAHTLNFLGMRREAEEVAYAWRRPLINNAILLIDILETDLTKPTPPYIEPERLARYGEVTLATGSGQGAQALAWYAYNSCQFEVARQWFERAVAWFPKEPTVFGYGLTLRRLKKRKEMIELVNRYDGLFAQSDGLLFPDGLIHPPTPCEQGAGRARATFAPGRALPTNAYDDNSYAQQTSARYGAAPQRDPMAGGARFYGQEAYGRSAAQGYVQDPARQYAWGRIAGPGEGGPSGNVMPRIDRAEFPIQVNPKNPLRFAPSAQPPIVNAAVGAIPPAAAGGFAQEPAPGAFPLVARRVPGVGPMPYERYGFALLPGYNGVTVPSSPTAAEQIAPTGTLWSLERRNSPAASGGAVLAPQEPAPKNAASSPLLDTPSPPKAAPMRNG